MKRRQDTDMESNSEENVRSSIFTSSLLFYRILYRYHDTGGKKSRIKWKCKAI